MSVCPVSLAIDEFAAMLNLELAEHPVYDGLELQWFDDDHHGTGLLVFLSRRSDRRIDYYAQPGLRLDRGTYNIGAGIGAWTETRFETGHLSVTPGGVDADVRFTDIDGRLIEIRASDRGGQPRNTGALLAPVSAGIDNPTELLVVWMPQFDLMHSTGEAPVVRIDGEDAAIGNLPGRALHRRYLVKYAAPLVTVSVGRDFTGPLSQMSDASHAYAVEDGVGRVTARSANHEAGITFTPAWPDLLALPEGAAQRGTWSIDVDGNALTGGTWFAERTGEHVALGLDVTRRWTPRGLPPLMRFVTAVVPVFRRWPTTYRWRAILNLGEEPMLAGTWQRTTSPQASAAG